jgi:5-methyltetrahydrofolate--homocysteine methyltransferase
VNSLATLSRAVVSGALQNAKDSTRVALREGLSPREILDEALVPGMEEVGRRFSKGEFYMPEMLVASQAMLAALDILKPLLTESDVKAKGLVVLGTVQGDLHNIGKDLVGMTLQGAGFEVVNLGEDVSPQEFVDAVRDLKPEILGMSALLTTTVCSMRATTEALERTGLRDQVKVMIGGAPVTQAYADEIGADRYAPDAVVAVEQAQELVLRMRSVSQYGKQSYPNS